ncbi:hypothetical protein BJP36_43230 [Moorena producens JHB]|uniref:Uncharacterized protein n=1 Tax=Moorena producens (strain JHB) TaxID=1454205 RepID=A0A9Q9ST47_MOOP1|nr:hypothetical protein [Moorena producens]WAN69175.1 hypothetical protein BJP36_43230 [Moorena producens JHB]
MRVIITTCVLLPNVYSVSRSYEVQYSLTLIPYSLFPQFPSWEGLGVGSCSLFPES